MIDYIIDDMIDEIESGLYDERHPLPSENALADEYRVSRHDIRRAYDRLCEMGYITTRAGVGRFAKQKCPKIEIALHGDESFTCKMDRLGHALTTKIVAVEVVEGYLAQMIDMKQNGGKIVRISRLRIIDGEAAALHTSYLSTATFPNILRDCRQITSLYDYYERSGYSLFYHTDTVLSSLLPCQSERELLECPSLVPLLLLETTCFDRESDCLIEMSKIVYRSDRFVYNISHQNKKVNDRI